MMTRSMMTRFAPVLALTFVVAVAAGCVTTGLDDAALTPSAADALSDFERQLEDAGYFFEQGPLSPSGGRAFPSASSVKRYELHDRGQGIIHAYTYDSVTNAEEAARRGPLRGPLDSRAENLWVYQGGPLIVTYSRYQGLPQSVLIESDLSRIFGPRKW